MSSQQIISPIHPVRQFQLDPNFRRKCEYYRTSFKNSLATAKYKSGAGVSISPVDFNIPITVGMTANDIQKYVVMTAKDTQEMQEFLPFWDGPRQIFSFDTHLAELLSHTEVADVPWEAVRVPYDHFYIHFGCVLERSLEINGKKYKADGAYVRVQRGASVLDSFLDGALHANVTTKVVEPSYEDAKRSNSLWISFKEPVYHVTISGKADDIVSFALERGREALLNLARQTDENLFQQSLKIAGEEGISIERACNLHAEEGRFLRGEKLTSEALPLLFNCIFYLTTISEPIEPVYPADAPQSLIEKLEKTTSPNRKKILSEDLERRGYTRIQFVRCPSLRDETLSLPTGRTIRTHWRRGHWRRQPCGIGLKRISLRWIQPCVVNADQGQPAVGRVYGVQEDEGGRS